jgi:DNA-binding beta-propeller fold protein YncE
MSYLPHQPEESHDQVRYRVGFRGGARFGRRSRAEFGQHGKSGTGKRHRAPGSPSTVHGLDSAVTITPDGRTVYVDGGFGGSNRGFIVPVSTATAAVGKPILVSGPPGVMAFTPNGKTLYVLLSGPPGLQDIIPVNTATNTAGPAIHTGLSPAAIAIAIARRT